MTPDKVELLNLATVIADQFKAAYPDLCAEPEMSDDEKRDLRVKISDIFQRMHETRPELAAFYEKNLKGRRLDTVYEVINYDFDGVGQRL